MNEEELKGLEKSLIDFLKVGKYVYPDITEFAVAVIPSIEKFVDLRMTLMRDDKEFMKLLWEGIIKYSRD